MHFIRTYGPSSTCLLSCIAAVVVVVGSANAAPADVPLKKSSLMEKLDSIDVEKQIRKRKGQSLDDLEKNSAALKDSIAALRTTFVTQDRPPAPEQTDTLNDEKQRTSHAYQKYIPRNAFDWVVLIVGGVAIIAGVILCVGFFTMVVGKKRNEKNTREQVMQKIVNRMPREKTPEHFPIVTAIPAGSEETTVDSLRKRIIEEHGEGPPADVPSAENTAEPGAPAISDSADLKKRILMASGEGAGITELSRRFHVSTDQVSLILRVAQQDRGEKV